jgi:3-oxoacyl-[acyl-carrier-protein] synthase-3
MPARTLHTAGITGVGMDFPERRLTNADLEEMVDTTAEWIVERTGIKERRIVEPGTPASYHGERAARQALDHAGLTADEIDLIVVPTVSPDMIYPATACLLQERLGAGHAWGFDLSAACCGFVFALQAARAQVESGAVRRALVVGTEVMSVIVDWSNRNNCILFGDGAGAVVIERVPAEEVGFIDSLLWVDGSGAELLKQEAGGSLHPASQETVAKGMHYLYQDGREVYKHAVKGMAKVTVDILERNDVAPENLDLMVPHQANKRIIEAAQRRAGLTPEQVMVTIDRFGNTTSASIPSALRVAVDEGRLERGDTVVLVAFGGGFTCGANLLRWTAG